MKLILNSKYSSDDYFGSGRKFEMKIPRNLERRIIRYRTVTDIEKIDDLGHAQDFFKRYGCTEPGPFAQRVALEYLLDNFVDDLGDLRADGGLGDSGALVEIKHYVEDTDEFIKRERFRFKYHSASNPGGYNIVVIDRLTGNEFTGITRIIELKKGGNRHVVLFDLISGEHTGRKDYLFRKTQAVFDFLGGKKDYTLSIVHVYPQDLFWKDLIPIDEGQSIRDSAKNKGVESFLNKYHTNLCLVFSHDLWHVRLLGNNIARSLSSSDVELRGLEN